MKTKPTLALLAALALVGSRNLPAQTAAWTEITHPTSPAFAHHDMTYDSLRHRLIVAGRTTPVPGGQFAAWVGAADGTWTQLPPPTPPPPGHDVEVAYDPVRQVAAFFGGERTLAPYDHARDTWAWDGTDWTKLETAEVPPLNNMRTATCSRCWFTARPLKAGHTSPWFTRIRPLSCI